MNPRRSVNSNESDTVAINLNAFTSCIHCRQSAPQGRFCVHCGKPLLQACPYELGEMVVPLVGSGGRPTTHSPLNGKFYQVCSSCHRLYDTRETQCRTPNCTGSLQPTTTLEDGAFGGSSRNACRFWYVGSVEEKPASIPLEDVPGEVEQAACAGELLALIVAQPTGRQLLLYDQFTERAKPRNRETLPPDAAANRPHALLLSGEYAGILNSQSATLVHTQPPVQVVRTFPLGGAPIAQAFSDEFWWLLTAERGRLKLTCLNVNLLDVRSVEIDLPADRLAQSIGTPQELLLLTRSGDLYRVVPETLQFTKTPLEPTLEHGAEVVGAAYDRNTLVYLVRAGTALQILRQDLGQSEGRRLSSVTFPDANLLGPILTPRSIVFCGERTAYVFDPIGGQVVTEALPDSALIRQVKVVTVNGTDHLFLHRRQNNQDNWDLWTPTQPGSRRVLGNPMPPNTLTGLTDDGLYLILPIASPLGTSVVPRTGGVARCEIRLWQFA